MDRIPLLLNMRAGALYEEQGPAQLQRMAGDVGLELEITIAHSPGEMEDHLKRLVGEGAPRVAIAGGDGTVALAVQHLAGTSTALGILSMGTFNNFATSLRLHHNLPAALRTLKEGVVRKVDLGQVGDRYFTEAAGAGLFADALALYGKGTNKSFAAGLRTVFTLALSFRPRQIKVVADGKTLSERTMLCEVMNTYRMAQAAPLAPEAVMDDGLLDVVLIGDLKPGEILPYLRALRAQMHLDLPKVKVLKAKEVRIESQRSRNIHCDDRVIGGTPQTIRVCPGALSVLVDQRL